METENTLGTKNLKRHWLLGCLPCKATCDRMTGDLIQVGWAVLSALLSARPLQVSFVVRIVPSPDWFVGIYV